MPIHTISKSRYLSGYQCLKKLYLEKYHPDLKPEVSLAQQAIFEQGHSVGYYARMLFPDGKDATPRSYYNFEPSIEKTSRWIADGEPVIYEAAFVNDSVLAALDILLTQNGERYAVEVKSSVKVKDYHIIDGSLQYWVMDQCGYPPDRFFIMHLNNQYIRDGGLNVAQLFTLTDITQQVLDLQQEVPERIAGMKATLAAREMPAIDIGPHCSSPFACDFMHHCWQHVPRNSMFEISRIGAKAWKYYERGILSINDLSEKDEANFTEKQLLQVHGVKHHQEVINRDRIRKWLDDLVYPLYFFDFETINPGIPVYNNSRPYQQLPVQYSLHIVKAEGSKPQHQEFFGRF
ncbi:MAG: DUF2779 domain-containing protein [Owenweeksia sp.]|nr:DUF2779 domain-containing protein [Owenweeksia sp.]